MKRILCIIIIVLSTAACRQNIAQNDSETIEYATLTVVRSDISLEETYPASIEGRLSIRIIPRVEGYLSEVRVKEGQRVKKGQVLFVIDQAHFLAEEKAARANVEVAKAGVESARLNYASRKGLREKEIVSDFDLQSAAANLSQAKAQLQQAEAQWEASRSDLAHTLLKSPSDGVVGSIPYRIGDYVGPTIQNGLTTIADDSQMYVYFSLTERDIMKRMENTGSMEKIIESFPPVSLKTALGKTYSHQGRLESVSGVVDRATGALSARAVFQNPEGELLSGSTGLLVIPLDMKQMVVIPQSATYEIQDKVYVYKIIDGKTQSAIISVLPLSDGQNYVVTAGLDEGDVIISKGAAYVKEGVEVK